MKPKLGKVVTVSGIVKALGYERELGRLTVLKETKQVRLRYVFLADKRKLGSTVIGSMLRVVLVGTAAEWTAKELTSLND